MMRQGGGVEAAELYGSKIEAAGKAIEHLAALDTAGYADLLILETLARYPTCW